MHMKTCTLPGCSAPRYQTRQLCGSHYMKQYRYGDPYYRAPSRSADLTGQRFGSLVADSRDAASRWLCRCDCGHEARVRTGDLRRGQQTCGDRARHPRQEVVGYAGAHDRVESVRGRAKDHLCVDCLGPAHDWSYDHADPAERHEALTTRGRTYEVPYSLDPNHYAPRCITCHRRFDRGRAHAA
jgi:hypothetical protein